MSQKIVVNLTNIARTWGFESVQFKQALAATGISHETAIILMEALGMPVPESKLDALGSLEYQIQNLAIRPKPT